ncbi:MAG: winged helix-turn-helix domain-containing protein [Caulobacteraceae bacterium]
MAELTGGAVDLARTRDFQIGGARVRPAALSVVCDGRGLPLEPRMMQVLVVLSEGRGQVVSREDLITRCWGGRIVGDDAVTQCAAKLRRVGRSCGAFTVEAVARVGYRLIAHPVSEAGETRAGPATRVAQFAVLAGNAQASLLAELLAGDISARLVGSHLPLAGATNRPAALDVDGAVIATGGLTEVRLRLLDHPTGQVLWAGSLRGHDPEVLRLQASWRVTSLVQMATESLAFPSEDLTADVLGLMIQSRDHARQSSWLGVSAAEEVVRLAPGYGRGRANLAIALSAASYFAEGERVATLIERCRAEAALAVRLTPDDPFAFVAQSLTLDGRDWVGRAEVLAQADALRPAGVATPWTAQLRLETGFPRAGLTMTRQLIETAKGYPTAGSQLISALFIAGEGARARRDVEDYLLLRPEDAGLRHSALMMALTAGDAPASAALLERWRGGLSYLTSAGEAVLAGVAQAQASGREADRLAAVSAVVAAAAARDLPRADATRLLCALNAPDAAVAMALAYADDPRTGRLGNFFEPRFLFGPDTALVRASPIFGEIAERLGLAAYWRATGIRPEFEGVGL